MKSDNKKQRKCTKKRYNDRQQAIAALHVISSRGEDRASGHKPIRYYFCVFCHGWHTTSQKSAYE